MLLVLKSIHMRALVLATLILAAATCVNALPAEGVAPANNRAYGSMVRELIQKANKRLWIMLYQTRYYEEYPDTLTNRLLEDLIAAKQRGVDVKIIFDTGDWNPSQKNEYNTDFADRLTTSGIEMWEDAPSEVSHQKVIVVDDDITVVSSNNWTFYSIAQNNEVAVAVFSEPVNAWFSKYFEDRKKGGHPRANVGTTATLSTKPSLRAADLPDLKKMPVADVKPIANRDFYPAVHDALLSATRSINVVQRSFGLYTTPPSRVDQASLPGEPASETNVLLQDLISAHKRGVKVCVILDYGDAFDNSQNAETARALQEAGVPVFRDDVTTQTHAKMLTIDDDKTIVGSTNWTYDAIEQGNEASVLITSPEVNKAYKAYVETLLQTGAPFEYKAPSMWDAPTSGAAQTSRSSTRGARNNK